MERLFDEKTGNFYDGFYMAVTSMTVKASEIPKMKDFQLTNLLELAEQTEHFELCGLIKNEIEKRKPT